MLVRSQSAPNYTVPEQTPFDGTEVARERSFKFPILLVPKVCVNYALVTQTTARSADRVLWEQMQTLFAASFLKYVPLSAETARQVWQTARQKIARSTSTLFFAAIVCPANHYILKYATLSDWLFFIGSCLKHPVATGKICRAIAAYPELWQFLDTQTALRSREEGFC
jgi:hypothetical protein